MKEPRVQVYAVVRIDANDALPSGLAGPGVASERLRGMTIRKISVTGVLPTLDEAAAEVDRLNALNADKGATYFWITTRYYPEGRKIDDAPRPNETDRSISLWSCLHDGDLVSVTSDRLERTVVMSIGVVHLRDRLGAAEDMTFVLRFEGVHSVRATRCTVWPGPPPTVPPGTPHAEQRKLVEEYQAKWREESIDWDSFETSLAPDGERIDIADARLVPTETNVTFSLQGNHSRGDRFHDIFIRAASISVRRSEGQPLSLDDFIALGQAYWRDFERRQP